MNMPLRFQNVCRHRQTNNTDHFPPPLTPPHVVSSPFRRASFKLALPFPKIPGRPSSADPHTAHVVFSLSCPASFKLSRLSRKSPAGRLSPPLAPHALFPHLSCRASLKFAYLSRKSPAGRLPPILTPHTLFSRFPVLFTAPLPDVFVSSF